MLCPVSVIWGEHISTFVFCDSLFVVSEVFDSDGFAFALW